MAPVEAPEPGNPPHSYAVVGDNAYFYRRVSEAEYDAWQSTAQLQPEPGGMAFGKHATTTVELALAWGKLLMKWEPTPSPGRVLQICLSPNDAREAHFVGPNTDAVGPCYFLSFGLLAHASISEVEQ